MQLGALRSRANFRPDRVTMLSPSRRGIARGVGAVATDGQWTGRSAPRSGKWTGKWTASGVAGSGLVAAGVACGMAWARFVLPTASRAAEWACSER